MRTVEVWLFMLIGTSRVICEVLLALAMRGGFVMLLVLQRSLHDSAIQI